MLTQCPACDTTFRVTAEQIKAKGGRVRCGQCQHAFNALDTLIDALPDSTLAPATEKRPDHFALPQHLLDEAATDATNSYTEDNDGVTPTITSSEILEFPEDIPDFETNAEEPRENFSDHPAPLEMPLEVASLTSSLTDLPEDTEEEKIGGKIGS
jgi:predicted Zn finger-like uncharacterized protein